ncbi:spore wall protein 2-like isoform X2 [Manihot esculenta]|uniref:spore wall protein 2-like isoform X2 n=1 Tax=Manihot esculenta TaxID=3983 RepID=UPI001CC722F2|nr:spore wall protein 2-like isoform X2 [Manihot esculenta]
MMDLEGLPMLCEGGVADNTTVEEVKFADSEGVKVADKSIGGDVEEGCEGGDVEEGSDGGDVEEGSDGGDVEEGSNDGDVEEGSDSEDVEEGSDGEEDSSDSENTTKRILVRNKDEPYSYDDPDYEGNQRDVYINYRRQYEESDGFDFDDYPKSGDGEFFLGVAFHVDLEDDDDEFTIGCKEALAYAIEEQNKKGANLRLLDIIKANAQSVALYHITFRAEDVSLGEVKVYQTKVFHSLVPGHKETVVRIFRLKEPTNKDDKAD